MGVVVHHAGRRSVKHGAGALRVGRPPQHRLGAGDELVEAERLLEVVVATERQPAHLVLDRVAGGEEQHRRAIAVEAQAPAHLEPVEVGHHHVEQHQIGLVRGIMSSASRPFAAVDDLEAVVTQGGSQHRAQVVLVVDDQQVGTGHAHILSPDAESLL